MSTSNHHEPASSGASNAEGYAALETGLMHLSPAERDEMGIGVTVNEAGSYVELDFDIPSGLALPAAARARLDALRARRIEYTEHTDREYETFFDFPATEWTWAAPFVHKTRDARQNAHRKVIQELRRVALDYLAGTVKEGSVDADAVCLLGRMMLRDAA